MLQRLDPLWLYVLVVVLGFMLSPRFDAVMAALGGQGEAVAAKAAGIGAAPAAASTRAQGK